MNNYEIDWNRLSEDEQQARSTSKFGTGEKSVFIKMKAGIHHLRIIPSGNSLEKLPYIKLMQHNVISNREDGSRQYAFVLCWSYVLKNLQEKKTEQEKKETSLMSYLGQQKLLTEEEFKKFQSYGCPFCKAYQHLNNLGQMVDAETRNKFYPKEQYLFNVIWRARDVSGDNDVYIWRTSKTQFNNIIAQIKLNKFEMNNNPLDPVSGKDLIVQATGEGLARRYPLIQFSTVQSVLNIGDMSPHNLLTVIDASFKTYQEAVNQLKIGFGKILSHYGYIIPGDMVIQQQYQQAAQMIDNVNPFTGTPLPPVPVGNIKPVGDVHQEGTGFAPMQEGDEIVYKDGKMINKRTGQVVF